MPDGPTGVTQTINVLSKTRSLSSVLDLSVFDESISDLAEKLAPARGGFLKRFAAYVSNRDYRNARRTIASYIIEPGSGSATSQIDMLDRALDLQNIWEGVTTGGQRPVPSADLDSLINEAQQLQTSLDLIISTTGDVTLGSDSFDATLVTLERLRETRDTLFRIPEMLRLEASLTGIGLGPFLDHLRDMGIRDVRSVQILMYVWLSSIVEHVTISE